jgi:cell division protein FtsQ
VDSGQLLKQKIPFSSIAMLWAVPTLRTPNFQLSTFNFQLSTTEAVQQTGSREQVKQRRRQLRRQRRVRAVKSLWRFGCMSGILASVAWVVNQPDWTISKPEQIQIQGNRYLSDATIRSRLAIRYPQSVMQLAPEQLTDRLLNRGSISSVKIDRRLLPPRLVVHIEDRPPVAQVLQSDSNPPLMFLDERGTQIPISHYLTSVRAAIPRLRVFALAHTMCPNWSQLYPAIHSSAVLIGSIDCRNPQNLILQTEVGKVRLGSFNDRQRLNQQIQQLDLLRDWRKHTNVLEVDYLDLENPAAPKLQLKRSGTVTPKLS